MREIKFEKLVPFFSVLVVVIVMFLSGHHATKTGAETLGYATIVTAFVVMFVWFYWSTNWNMIEAHHGFQAEANEWLIRSRKSERKGEVTQYEVLPIGTLKLAILFVYFPIIWIAVPDPIIQWIIFFLFVATAYQMFFFVRAQTRKQLYLEELRPWKQ